MARAKTNIRRIVAKEVGVVADLLADPPVDEIENLAKAICRAINVHRATEENWVRVVKHGSGYLMYGPYRSADEARHDDQSRGPSRTDDVTVACWSLIPPYGQAEEGL